MAQHFAVQHQPRPQQRTWNWKIIYMYLGYLKPFSFVFFRFIEHVSFEAFPVNWFPLYIILPFYVENSMDSFSEIKFHERFKVNFRALWHYSKTLETSQSENLNNDTIGFQTPAKILRGFKFNFLYLSGSSCDIG